MGSILVVYGKSLFHCIRDFLILTERLMHAPNCNGVLNLALSVSILILACYLVLAMSRLRGAVNSLSL